MQVEKSLKEDHNCKFCLDSEYSGTVYPKCALSVLNPIQPYNMLFKKLYEGRLITHNISMQGTSSGVKWFNSGFSNLWERVSEPAAATPLEAEWNRLVPHRSRAWEEQPPPGMC